MLNRRKFERLLDDFEPLMRRAMLRAVSRIKSRARIAALEAAIRAGNLDAAVLAAGIRPGEWGILTESIRDAFIAAGEATAAAAPARFGFMFDISNDRADEWLRDNSSRLITRLNEEQREVVRLHLRAGLEDGRNPRSTALDLSGRINRATGRREGGTIGLTRPQSMAALNNQRDLLSGDSTRMQRYFGRSLRDKRFDSIVARAMEQGRRVSQADVTRITTRYTERLLRHRAEVIARTETLQSMSAARDEAVMQAADEGLIQDRNIKRVWRTAADSRVRDIHQPMNGQERREREPFDSGNGRQLMFPGDQSLGAGAANVIQCRCSVEYRIDWVEEERARP